MAIPSAMLIQLSKNGLERRINNEITRIYNYPTGIDFDKYYDTYQKQNIFDMTVA